MEIITRFAPSPTGYLHIGGARTALFSWLYAKRHQGKCYLRIEDTDVERSTEASAKAIFEAFKWLGINFDTYDQTLDMKDLIISGNEQIFVGGNFQEGEIPHIKQSDRLRLYHVYAQKLLSKGHAYKCYCSKEKLEALREEQIKLKQKPKYDGHCRNVHEEKDKPYVIRFKTPLEGSITFNDLVFGLITVQNEELDDLVIMRGDMRGDDLDKGIPTYNFSATIDDWLMKITHVIRGDDHINNTPRQIHILNALGAPIPTYAHLPMILNEEGKRLSKRKDAASVGQYREEGILPEALLNYLVRLGWSHGDQEIFTLDEMISFFDVGHISRSAATFNRDKLLWLNQHYMKSMAPEEAVRHFMDYLKILIASFLKPLGIEASTNFYHDLKIILENEANHMPSNSRNIIKMFSSIKHESTIDPNFILKVINTYRTRCKTLKEMVAQIQFLFEDQEYNEESAKLYLTEKILLPFKEFKSQLSALNEWNPESIHHIFEEILKKYELKMPQLAQPVRVALTGNTISPSIDKTIYLLRKKKTVERLEKAIQFIEMKQ